MLSLTEFENIVDWNLIPEYLDGSSVRDRSKNPPAYIVLRRKHGLEC